MDLRGLLRAILLRVIAIRVRPSPLPPRTLLRLSLTLHPRLTEPPLLRLPLPPTLLLPRIPPLLLSLPLPLIIHSPPLLTHPPPHPQPPLLFPSHSLSSLSSLTLFVSLLHSYLQSIFRLLSSHELSVKSLTRL